jgi:hypothetical protein
MEEAHERFLEILDTMGEIDEMEDKKVISNTPMIDEEESEETNTMIDTEPSIPNNVTQSILDFSCYVQQQSQSMKHNSFNNIMYDPSMKKIFTNKPIMYSNTMKSEGIFRKSVDMSSVSNYPIPLNNDNTLPLFPNGKYTINSRPPPIPPAERAKIKIQKPGEWAIYPFMNHSKCKTKQIFIFIVLISLYLYFICFVIFILF